MSDSTNIDVSELLKTVLESIFEVVVVCLTGYALSRAAIIDKTLQRKINRLNISIFTPSLLFSKVAFTLTPSKLKELLIIPIAFVVVTGTSTLVAWSLSHVFRLKKSQRSFAMAGAMFMNSNSLPIALMQSLIVEVPGLKWEEDDTPDAMVGRALTYLVLYSTIGMVLRWSYGVHLLTQADDEATPLPTTSEEPRPLANSDLNVPDVNTPLIDDRRFSSISEEPSVVFTEGVSAHSLGDFNADDNDPWRDSTNSNGNGGGVSNITVRPRPTKKFSGNVYSPAISAANTETDDSLADDDELLDGDDIVREDPAWGAAPDIRPGFGRSVTSSRWQAAWRRNTRKVIKFLKVINDFMTMPMWAAFTSIFIAMVPPLQAQLATLRPAREAIKSLGQCSIPLTLLVLGAYFNSSAAAKAAESGVSTGTTSKKSEGWFSSWWTKAKTPAAHVSPRHGENKTVAVAIIARMILTPFILLPMLALCARFDLFEAAEDPVFIVTATLIITSPPAITLAQITQAASGDAFERLISKTIFISYAILTPPLTLAYVVLGLFLSRL